MRAIINEGRIYFAAKDVCAELNISEDKIAELPSKHKSVFKLKDGSTELMLDEKGLKMLIPVQDGEISVGEFVKELKHHGVFVKSNKFADWLYRNGYFDDKELFKVTSEHVSLESGSSVRCTFAPKITQAGRKFFINGFTSGAFSL